MGMGSFTLKGWGERSEAPCCVFAISKNTTCELRPALPPLIQNKRGGISRYAKRSEFLGETSHSELNNPQGEVHPWGAPPFMWVVAPIFINKNGWGQGDGVHPHLVFLR
jgi:hypothetical protein